MVEGREEAEGHLGILLLWSRSMVMVTRGRTEVVAFVRNSQDLDVFGRNMPC